MSNVPKNAINSLYRTFRRQINLLPSEYLRQFFRIKLADDVRSVLTASNRDGKLQKTKFKRVLRELRKLEAAHAGNPAAYAHILDVAYGRKGKLRWEIMEPLLSDPNTPAPNRIIPAVEKSRPPVYSPELTTLLTSSSSRDKPLHLAALSHPPTLPNRVDPESEEARLLGRLSKRREVKIRWRFFSDEWKKVYPPLQIGVSEVTSVKDAPLEMKTDRGALARAGIRPIGLQDSGVHEDLIASAGPAIPSRAQTRREKLAFPEESGMQDSMVESTLPRFIRRRFRQLLARVPMLNYSYKVNESTGQHSGRYAVVAAPNAMDASTRYGGPRVPEAYPSYLAWVHEPVSKAGKRSRVDK